MTRRAEFVVALGVPSLIGSLLLGVDAASARSPGAVSVVARGLANPRHLVVDDRGDVYVAEAGRGAPDPSKAPCVRTPDPETGKPASFCYGPSAAVTRIRGGSARRVVTGLPSVAVPGGQNASGLTDLTVPDDGHAVGVVGLGRDPRKRTTTLPRPAVVSAGHLVRLDVRRDAFRVGADVSAFEAEHNPDFGDPRAEVDSNPYAVVQARRGAVLVADAGGNDLLRVDDDGDVTLLAVFRARMFAAPAVLKAPPGAKLPVQAVPTSVVQGPDGAWYVGELTGFPFLRGVARVWRVTPGKAPTVYASGFTNVIDLAFDSRGRLLVLEMARNGLLDPRSPGALWRVGRDGSKSLVTSALTAPGGLAVSGDTAYVTNLSNSPTDGQVVRVSLP
jgi:hypothetical protein